MIRYRLFWLFPLAMFFCLGLFVACGGAATSSPSPTSTATEPPTLTETPINTPIPTSTPTSFSTATPTSVPPTPTLPPTVAEILAHGEELDFEVCGESTTWVRPPEQEQRAQWWSSGRYAGGNEDVIKYPWTHNFFMVYGHASGESDITNLSGLWTLPGEVRAKCFEPEPHDAVLRLETAEAWVLLHRVKSIKRLDRYYVVVVEPTEKGVQFVQFPRLERQLPLTLHFITEDEQEIETIVEAESPYWPYPQLIPASQP